MQIANIIKEAGLTESTSEAVRLIQQGAVRVDNAVITNRNTQLNAGKTILLQVGKRRFAHIILK